MKIKYKPINGLVNADYNPRKINDNDFEQLKKSLDSFDCVEPAVVNINPDRENIIIGGHQRIKAAKALGWVDFPCVEVNLTLEQEKELNVRLNKNTGEFDFDLLELHYNKDDLIEWGFKDDELPWDVEQLEQFNESIQDDIPEGSEKIITVKGDVWQLGDHRLMCGDCTIETDLELLLDGEKVNSLQTDPPYGVDYSSKNDFLNQIDGSDRNQTAIINNNIDDYRHFFTSFLSIVPFAEYNTIYCWMFGSELHNLRLAYDDADIKWGDYLIWVKNNHVLGRKDYAPKHEFCVYGWKGKHKFYGGFSTTLLEFDKPLKNDLHPTMKPVSLIEKCITDGTQKGDLVYDAFGGSGSTLIACEKTGRKCCMMELSENYVDVIIKRWQNLTNKEAVHVSSNKTYNQLSKEKQ